ncbi:MAG TPA: cytochrome d ubiquinol oxidase subunit II [Alphaproteobacteria bacterium]|nr:cytochrome d ubiquinol oxidase subunit II [Alphaproteobacteria bacterium]
MFDYETLRVIWWALLGTLLIGFAVMDGFDLGSGILLPFVARNDPERRVVVNSIGPVWEGNQVWLILGAGAIFAAWPMLYAVAFSGFYLAMFVVLGSLILRPVAITFRGKMPGAVWRRVWDCCLFISGAVPSLVFGVAFGNAIEGVPFTFDPDMHMIYKGGFFALLNPFGLLCGAVAVSMIALQGATWLSLKTDGRVQKRARHAAVIFAMLTPVLFLIGGLWAGGVLDGYRFISAAVPGGPSNPMLKTVARLPGAWMDNYNHYPLTLLAPAVAIFGAVLALIGIGTRKHLVSFIGSSLVQAGVIGTAGVCMFPFLLPSSLNPDASLTVWDASSSRLTLAIMFWTTVIFLPIVAAYTAWVYRVLRGKVTVGHIKENSDNLY